MLNQLAKLLALILSSSFILTATAQTPETRHTPHGLRPAHCVHEVPSGSKIKDMVTHAQVTRPDGTVEVHYKCAEAGALNIHTAMDRQLDATSGHITDDDKTPAVLPGQKPVEHCFPLTYTAWLDQELDYFSANYTVPERPEHVEGETVFWWIGAEDSPTTSVIQPVLAFENGYWLFTSWNCCPAGHTFHSKGFAVEPGQNDLFGMLVRVGNDYNILSQAGEKQSILVAEDAPAAVAPMFALETYRADCNTLPASPMVLSNVRMIPSARHFGFGSSGFNLSEDCGWNTIFDGSGLYLLPPHKGGGRHIDAMNFSQKHGKELSKNNFPISL
ncbi:hypothetical protein [Endozoicomonas sp. ONNA2]|uniref:hypothetical protein n=1 Tax=Endozoicomonas sp. ONNA2 TaxID=2828741 RepID=UPI0021490C88|nr:hypothetical protein [Endozoicomonas sp. ONNA2]